MGKTKIEWCDYTFNPWIGCSKVSPGCENCYAENLMDDRFGRVKWGPNGTRKKTSEANWKKPLMWNRKAEAEGNRYKVFCASLADIFENRPELSQWRMELFSLIEETSFLDWLILTKRPENVYKMVDELWWEQTRGGEFSDFPENLWMGVSVENQEQANIRIPQLLKIPAKVRFLSCEPLLEELSLTAICSDGPSAIYNKVYFSALSDYGIFFPQKVDWVIVGGESGHNARPMHPDWVRSIRDQCVDAGVPFLFKQWGAWKPINTGGVHYGDICLSTDGFMDTVGNHYVCFANESEGTIMRQVGKLKAGRELDGVEWNQFPNQQSSLNNQQS